MDFSQFKKLSIGSVELKQLFINGIQVWKSGYKNWVRYSTTDDGKTIYNGGLGYKEGYRIRSGGAEVATSEAVCTGFMPFKQGDILEISPPFSGQNTINTLNFANSSFTNIGQYNDSGDMYGICYAAAEWKNIATEIGSVTRVDISGVPNGGDIAYVRLTHAYKARNTANEFEVQSGADLIVTINEKIE